MKPAEVDHEGVLSLMRGEMTPMVQIGSRSPRHYLNRTAAARL